MGFPPFGLPFGGRGFGKLVGQGGGSNPPVTFASYMASLGHLLFLPTNETSGTTAENLGSLGDAADGVLTPGTGGVGATTPMGPNTAYTFDGADTIITVPNNATINGLTKFTYGIYIKAAGAGESNVGRFMGTSGGAARSWRIGSASLPVSSFLTSSLVTAFSVTANNFIALNTDYFLFQTYNNDGDRKIRIYKYPVGGSLIEATYVTQDAMTGTIVIPSFDLVIGGQAAGAVCFNGKLGKPFINSNVFSEALMAQIGALALPA